MYCGTYKHDNYAEQKPEVLEKEMTSEVTVVAGQVEAKPSQRELASNDIVNNQPSNKVKGVITEASGAKREIKSLENIDSQH